MSLKRLFALIITILLIICVIWLATTSHLAVWPVRNSLQYQALTWWWHYVGEPQQGEPGVLTGTITNQHGEPLSGAWVLLSRWDGTTYHCRTDDQGRYQIDGIPAGNYQPAAGAPDYDNQLGEAVTIEAGQITMLPIRLSLTAPHSVSPAQRFSLSEPTSLTCYEPFVSTANRRQVYFDNAGQPNQLTFYYTPITTTARLPILLVIYPGPVDSWECASIPLTAGGFTVLAVGPPYSFAVEAQLDELERLIDLAQGDVFPHGDGQRVGLLGGSFSSIHVQRIIQRRQDVQAALLLGPPTDMFAMRHHLESGTFIPPFGLDQIMLAAGFPDREMMRYWRYSAAYHVRPDFPPLAILHSRSDEVVPIEQSERLATNLAAVGAVHETYFFDGASHYLMAAEADEDTDKVYHITLDFFARHLAQD
ncbi:carboxypeptidase regulatory-like domain-containing protein [Anaerolineales bacterium HSG24]|nr:carboxypeptidase regulatory-like domain-containing protein [Anaerolineales bacterium HSG24]